MKVSASLLQATGSTAKQCLLLGITFNIQSDLPFCKLNPLFHIWHLGYDLFSMTSFQVFEDSYHLTPFQPSLLKAKLAQLNLFSQAFFS